MCSYGACQDITGYLGLRTFGDAEATLLEKFVFDADPVIYCLPPTNQYYNLLI